MVTCLAEFPLLGTVNKMRKSLHDAVDFRRKTDSVEYREMDETHRTRKTNATLLSCFLI